eukprot:8127686-Pyramimonas_sp.AAC.1
MALPLRWLASQRRSLPSVCACGAPAPLDWPGRGRGPGGFRGRAPGAAAARDGRRRDEPPFADLLAGACYAEALEPSRLSQCPVRGRSGRGPTRGARP